MDFLKDVIQVQHEIILHQVSDKLLTTTFEKDHFMNQFNKINYCLVKVCNCRMKRLNCVKIDLLLSTLECDHNPSSS